LRFTIHEVAVTADIEKAFLNIEIDPDINKESPEVMLL